MIDANTLLGMAVNVDFDEETKPATIIGIMYTNDLRPNKGFWYKIKTSLDPKAWTCPENLLERFKMPLSVDFPGEQTVIIL